MEFENIYSFTEFMKSNMNRYFTCDILQKPFDCILDFYDQYFTPSETQRNHMAPLLSPDTPAQMEVDQQPIQSFYNGYINLPNFNSTCDNFPDVPANIDKLPDLPIQAPAIVYKSIIGKHSAIITQPVHIGQQAPHTLNPGTPYSAFYDYHALPACDSAHKSLYVNNNREQMSKSYADMIERRCSANIDISHQSSDLST